MKMIRKVMSVALCLMMTACLWAMVAYATGLAVTANAADDDEYEYTVYVYSGKEGYFGDNKNNHVKKYTGLKYGEEIRLDINDLELKLVDDETYYARGIKIAGHDNDEISQRNYMSITFKVTGDESFSVAYGIKGGMVRYTIRYVDADSGATLRADDVYYGAVGDKPVVSYKFIDGYMPDVYNYTKTITENEADNVFTFTYTASDNGDDGAAGAGAGGAGAAGAGGAGAAGTAIADGATPLAGPDNVVDLDDGATPLSDGTDITDNDTPAGLSAGAKIGIGACVVALAAAAAIFAVRRRREYEYEDEE